MDYQNLPFDDPTYEPIQVILQDRGCQSLVNVESIPKPVVSLVYEFLCKLA